MVYFISPLYSFYVLLFKKFLWKQKVASQAKSIDETTKSKSINYNLVQNAINNKSELEITYKDFYGNKTNRRIIPNILIHKKRIDYLRAFCKKRKRERTFRIDRIIQIK